MQRFQLELGEMNGHVILKFTPRVNEVVFTPAEAIELALKLIDVAKHINRNVVVPFQ